MKRVAIPFLIAVVTIIVMFLIFENLETYFTNLLQGSSKHILTYSLVSFIVLASDIILPVPSSIVMYTNGYVLGMAGGSAISLAALMVGSVVGYYLGKYTSIGLKTSDDEKANNILSRYGSMAIIISRGIPIIAESVCIVCGYNKMNFKNYFILNLVGYIPLCLMYAFFGTWGYDKNIFLISFAISFAVSVLFWFAGRKFLYQLK